MFLVGSVLILVCAAHFFWPISTRKLVRTADDNLKCDSRLISFIEYQEKYPTNPFLEVLKAEIEPLMTPEKLKVVYPLSFSLELKAGAIGLSFISLLFIISLSNIPTFVPYTANQIQERMLETGADERLVLQSMEREPKVLGSISHLQQSLMPENLQALSEDDLQKFNNEQEQLQRRVGAQATPSEIGRKREQIEKRQIEQLETGTDERESPGGLAREGDIIPLNEQLPAFESEGEGEQGRGSMDADGHPQVGMDELVGVLTEIDEQRETLDLTDSAMIAGTHADDREHYLNGTNYKQDLDYDLAPILNQTELAEYLNIFFEEYLPPELGIEAGNELQERMISYRNAMLNWLSTEVIPLYHRDLIRDYFMLITTE